MNNNSSSVPTSGNLLQFNDVLQSKESELKILLYQRNVQLENYLKIRDELLLEATTKYEALREDFDYNLSLIKARDDEIQHLEKIYEEEKKRISECEQKYQKISHENQFLLQKQNALLQKLEQEKAKHQVNIFFLF
jgi:chromosome segregation ATPase